MFLNAFPWHGVAWLYDTVMPDQIEDKDDLWIKTWGTPLSQNHHGGKSRKALLQQEEIEWVNAHQHSSTTSVTRMLHLASNILTGAIVITLYLVSTVLTGIDLNFNWGKAYSCFIFNSFTIDRNYFSIQFCLSPSFQH